MKKYLSVFIVILCASYAWAQIPQRSDVMPGFFVPDGALRTTPKAEKLPPIEAMAYGEKMSEAYRKAQERKQALEQEKKQQEAAMPNANVQTPEKPKADLKEIAKHNSFLPQNMQKKTPSTKVQITDSTNIKPEISVPDSNVKTTNIEQSPTKTANTRPTDEQAQTDSPQKIFERIFTEHWQDLETIARGGTVNNPRLNKILADYQNQEHLF